MLANGPIRRSMRSDVNARTGARYVNKITVERLNSVRESFSDQAISKDKDDKGSVGNRAAAH
jgi:hypothetical protein